MRIRKKKKRMGTFTFTGPDGKQSKPIPYNASMRKISKEARRVGYNVVKLL